MIVKVILGVLFGLCLLGFALAVYDDQKKEENSFRERAYSRVRSRIKKHIARRRERHRRT